MNNIFEVLTKICQFKEDGGNVFYEERPKQLGWAWVNQDTNQEIGFIKLTDIKNVPENLRSDPRFQYILQFIKGGDPVAARDSINKLNNLKAFW